MKKLIFIIFILFSFVSFGQNGRANSRNVIVGEGGTSVHNNLTGLQGGAAGDYYHVLQAELLNLQDSIPDSLAAHNTRIIELLDSISLFRDSINSFTSQIYINADSINIHADSIAALSTRSILGNDSLDVHTDSIAGISWRSISNRGLIAKHDTDYVWIKTDTLFVGGDTLIDIDAIVALSDSVWDKIVVNDTIIFGSDTLTNLNDYLTNSGDTILDIVSTYWKTTIDSLGSSSADSINFDASLYNDFTAASTYTGSLTVNINNLTKGDYGTITIDCGSGVDSIIVRCWSGEVTGNLNEEIQNTISGTESSKVTIVYRAISATNIEIWQGLEGGAIGGGGGGGGTDDQTLDEVLTEGNTSSNDMTLTGTTELKNIDYGTYVNSPGSGATYTITATNGDVQVGTTSYNGHVTLQINSLAYSTNFGSMGTIFLNCGANTDSITIVGYTGVGTGDLVEDGSLIPDVNGYEITIGYAVVKDTLKVRYSSPGSATTDDQIASEVNITDAGGNYTATNVEAALTEIADANYLTGNQTITLGGDASGSGTTSISVSVIDDTHNHTGTTISGIDTLATDINRTNFITFIGNHSAGGSGYWTRSGGYITPTTYTDKLRIGSTADLGSYIGQFTGNVAMTGYLHLNTTSSHIRLKDMGGQPGTISSSSSALFVRNDSLLFKDDSQNIHRLMNSGISSPFTADTYGYTTSSKIGIGGASQSNYPLTVTSSTSGYPAGYFYNSNANGYGLRVVAGSTGADYSFRVSDYNNSSNLFYVMGNGDVYAPGIAVGGTSYPLYINPTNGQLTYGGSSQNLGSKSSNFDFDASAGLKGYMTLTGSITITIINLEDNQEGSIEITNSSTYTLSINGSTGYTTKQIMGSNSAIQNNDHTTLVYWRTGSTLYYGFIYDN